MNRDEARAADDPHEWLKRAQSNLAMAAHRGDGIFLEDLCFEAQQAAEKAIKAVMVAGGVEFPYIHDLAELLRILRSSGESIPDHVGRADGLTAYAVVTRYPNMLGPVTEAEYEDALSVARAVVAWAEERI